MGAAVLPPDDSQRKPVALHSEPVLVYRKMPTRQRGKGSTNVGEWNPYTQTTTSTANTSKVHKRRSRSERETSTWESRYSGGYLYCVLCTVYLDKFEADTRRNMQFNRAHIWSVATSRSSKTHLARLVNGSWNKEWKERQRHPSLCDQIIGRETSVTNFMRSPHRRRIIESGTGT